MDDGKSWGGVGVDKVDGGKLKKHHRDLNVKGDKRKLSRVQARSRGGR